jgi:hypothetical protein
VDPTANPEARRFTLAQGVITGVVVALLLLILAPVYTSDGRRSLKTRCISNMKQLTTSQLIYAADFDEAIVPVYTFDGPVAQSQFFEAMIPYAKNAQIFLCGESPAYWSEPNGPEINRTAKRVEYAHFPLILRHVVEDHLINLDRFASPETEAWMHEPILKITKVPNGEEIETHHEKAKYGFVASFFDGHVKFVPTLKGGTSDPMTTDGVWLK